jgi:hypothetical protein
MTDHEIDTEIAAIRRYVHAYVEAVKDKRVEGQVASFPDRQQFELMDKAWKPRYETRTMMADKTWYHRDTFHLHHAKSATMFRSYRAARFDTMRYGYSPWMMANPDPCS